MFYQELKKECAELKQKHRSLKSDFIRLKQDKESKERNLQSLENRLKEMHMLKFGRVIDLDALEAAEIQNLEAKKQKPPTERVLNSVVFGK